MDKNVCMYYYDDIKYNFWEEEMKIKNFMSIATALSLSLVLASCGANTDDASNEKATDNDAQVEESVDEAADQETAEDDTADAPEEDENKEEAAETPTGEEVSVTMVTDFGGVNDKSFNQSAYEGLQKAEEEGEATFDYIESHKEADFVPNLESALDSESDLILTVGYALFPATDEAAEENPEQNYVIIDNANENDRPNLLGVNFADHQNSFLVGYIAGMQSETNNVGFVGGIQSAIIDRFEYGFRAGVEQAAREKEEEITVQVQYANSFDDQAAGKNIADRMYQEGADVIFHAAGGVGIGVIEAAKENDKWVVGVDRDQQDEAPDHMLVSTVKGVGDAVRQIIDEFAQGKFEGGDQTFTLADGESVTIAYAENGIVSQEIKDKVEELKQEIIDGNIEVPENEEQALDQGWIEE